jgi:acyl-CoA dehydrogenase
MTPPASTMTGGDNLLETTLDQILTASLDTEARQRAEESGWALECWDALAEGGMPWVGVDESAGGAGGELNDACSVVQACGRFAVPLPVAETGLIGGAVAAARGLEISPEPLTVPVPVSRDHLTIDRSGRVTGELHYVPWARRASAVVALAQDDEGLQLVLLDPHRADIVPGHNVAGEPREHLTFDQAPIDTAMCSRCDERTKRELELRGALSRSLLMAGASTALVSITARYAAERRQFGRPIARFQAVSNRLARLSSEAQAAATIRSMVDSMVAAETGDQSAQVLGAEFGIMAANIATIRSAMAVAAEAHQIHGAIGMTQEYVLQQFSRRIFSWAQEWGSARSWSEAFGRRLISGGVDNIWSSLTANRFA